jgi:hypothetical protein
LLLVPCEDLTDDLLVTIILVIAAGIVAYYFITHPPSGNKKRNLEIRALLGIPVEEVPQLAARSVDAETNSAIAAREPWVVIPGGPGLQKGSSGKNMVNSRVFSHHQRRWVVEGQGWNGGGD